MRCKQVFNGKSFALGLFESNVSPNGISTSPCKSKTSSNPRNFIKEQVMEIKGSASYKRPTNISNVSSKFVPLSQT
jgi:hypothetical protein